MKILLAALLLATPAAASAPSASFADAMGICRTIFLENPDKGMAMFKALSDEDQKDVAVLCVAYRQGALDLLEAARKETQEHMA